MEPQNKSRLKSIVLTLRHILEGTYDAEGKKHPGDLENRLISIGIHSDREPIPLSDLPHLTAEDQDARNAADAFIQTHIQSGQTRKDALVEFIQEAAYTWANRLIALRCLEARGLIDEIILQKDSYGGRSLQHHRLSRQNPELCAGDDDGLYAVLFAESTRLKSELPLLFHPDEPIIALRPGVAALKRCIQCLCVPDELFMAPDALGWAYQYWNAEEKDRVFASVRTVKGAKIEKRDIIPVTQLYTEQYMVKFLVQNSLGALWMSMVPDSKLCDTWEYYVRDADREPVTPRPVKQISFLDPCAGSGHFLLEAFDLFYAMYQAEGELTKPNEICNAILTHNLFGIDIDERAIQISGLALVMKAKEIVPDFHIKHLNLTATNIYPAGETNHLTNFFRQYPEYSRFQFPIKMVFRSLVNAGELGSLLQIAEPIEKEFRYLKAQEDENQNTPKSQMRLFQSNEPKQQRLPLGIPSYDVWKSGLLTRMMTHIRKEYNAPDFSRRFFGETAEKGMNLFDFLSRQYDVVATNPPYMGSKNMGPVVKQYVEAHFTPGKRDLYAAFILRCLELAKPVTGRVAMVTQQSWMFLRSFADLRALQGQKLEKSTGFTGILRETSIETLAHLGPGAFAEISGEVVNIVLFTANSKPPAENHHLTAFRLIGAKGTDEKNSLLSKKDNTYISRPYQKQFLPLPQTPLCYWLRPRFFELLSGPTLGDVADVVQGLATADDGRFVRYHWESPDNTWTKDVAERRWVPFEKGGGYGLWIGHQWWAVDWEFRGKRIKSTANPRVQNEQYYFRDGWTYSLISCGIMGCRNQDRAGIIGHKGPGIYLNNDSISIVLNSRIFSYLVRTSSPNLSFEIDNVNRGPVPTDEKQALMDPSILISLKRQISNRDILEYSFDTPSIKSLSDIGLQIHSFIPVMLLVAEGLSEKIVFYNYGLDMEDISAVITETGTPAGWFPLIENYDILPPVPDVLPEIPAEVLESLQKHERQPVSPVALSALQTRLQSLYQAGPGVKEEIVETNGDTSHDDDDEDNEQIAIGARIPIPAETFLEELSQKMEIHPISIYWLLKEGIEQQGWRCIPEEQRLTRDRFTVMILRLLGHRWPKQIEAGEDMPEWADMNGIIPLTSGFDQTSFYQRLRDRLAEDVGDRNVTAEESRFAEIMGKDLDGWVKRDFFRHHASQFKKRPIVWHLTSSRWKSRGMKESACEFLIYYHRMDADLLPRLSSHYLTPLIKRLEMELHYLENRPEKTLTADQLARKQAIPEQIAEVNSFNQAVAEVVASGFCPKNLENQLKQHAINDAMLCLKARWLRKLRDLAQENVLDWQKVADETGLHPEFANWIADSITNLDFHCAVVGPKPPDEQKFPIDPESADLAMLICEDEDTMCAEALRHACDTWWKPFELHVLKPLSDQIRDINKKIAALKDISDDPATDFRKDGDTRREIRLLKDELRKWKTELKDRTTRGAKIRFDIQAWKPDPPIDWKDWLSGQAMYDQLSAIDERRPPPASIAEFVRQESRYQPDINDGVRVNIAPLQKAGVLAADVLAAKDVEKAILDRAVWRDDERRWCRQGTLPQPGWWPCDQEEKQ